MPVTRLIQPNTLDDMLLYQLWHAGGGGRTVMRMCETEYGISRRVSGAC